MLAPGERTDAQGHLPQPLRQTGPRVWKPLQNDAKGKDQADAVLLAGAALYVAFGTPLGNGTPRWPTADAMYAADGWSVGPQQLEGTSTVQVTRVLRSTTGATATLAILSNQAFKLYAAGAEVPFLGSGYSVDTLPADLEPLTGDGVHGLIATRSDETWLVMYAYGERRGLLGNGPTAWALAVFDGMVGRPNDYYKLYLFAPIDASQPDVGRGVANLATRLFPRIAAYYSTSDPDSPVRWAA